MLSKNKIKRYRLKQGADYIRICGINMKKGDSFKFRGRTVIIVDIIDEQSFLDEEYEFWDSSMFDCNDVICKCQMGGLSEYRKYSGDIKD